ncbi:MAG: gfo/Idh/MocA family oxidoreductase, partial [Chloroflexota bacterium]
TSRDNLGASVDRVTVRRLGKRAHRLDLPVLPQIDRAGSLRAFAGAVASGKQPESSGRDNLGSIRLMYAAIEASITGAPVRL